MMPLFKSQHRRRGRRGLAHFLPVAALLFIILIMVVLFPTFFGGIFAGLGEPIWNMGSKISEQGRVSLNAAGTSVHSVVRENGRLKRENQELGQEILRLTALLEEASGTSTSQGDVDGHRRAYVLSTPGKSAYDTLIIDIGSEGGIREGDRIYSYPQVRIGSVVRVNPGTAVVELFTTPGNDVEVVLKDGVHATARGHGGGSFFIELPQTVDVEIGDIVRAATERGVVLGEIRHITDEVSTGFKGVIVESPVNPFELRYVYVENNE